MPTYFYWGEADFAIAKAVKQLKQEIVDPAWLEFNFHQYPGDSQETIIAALNEVMTPAFAMGGKLVHLHNTTICQQCSADLLAELTQTLPKITDDAHLLFTTTKKPDSRLKSTKLIKKIARVQEFNLIPYWDEKAIVQNIRQLAAEMKVNLDSSAIALLKDFVGNDTRRLSNELAKLSLYQSQTENNSIDAQAVSSLVICNTQNSLKLAQAIRDRKIETALSLVNDLLAQNEPPLKIVATLIGQFRIWTTLKVVWESGQKDYASLAKIAEIKGNPNRIKYLLLELQNLSARQLLSTLPLLLELEYKLKKGAASKPKFITTIISICQQLDTN